MPVNADVPSLEAILVEEHDPHVNALGIKGVGEIGVTGTAGAVANAVWHATGVRVRRVPDRSRGASVTREGARPRTPPKRRSIVAARRGAAGRRGGAAKMRAFACALHNPSSPLRVNYSPRLSSYFATL